MKQWTRHGRPGSDVVWYEGGGPVLQNLSTMSMYILLCNMCIYDVIVYTIITYGMIACTVISMRPTT